MGVRCPKLLKQSLPPGAFSILQRINRILRRRYLFLDEMRPWRIGKRTDFHFTTTLAPAEAMELKHLYGRVLLLSGFRNQQVHRSVCWPAEVSGGNAEDSAGKQSARSRLRPRAVLMPRSH